MYQYETHLHTCEASACGTTHGADYPAFYRSIGYDGIIITDHFFNGNCRVPHYDSWEQRVEEFCSGYESAKKAGDAIGFPVFFGWEANFEGDEFLVYGLDKEWLLKHPDILSWNRKEHYERIHADGGLVVQAHPFRERGYLSAVHINPTNCDAWEGYNAFNDDYMNFHAVQYARDHGIFLTAGSDFHKVGSKDPAELYGMCFETPLTSIHDYVSRIQAHEGTPRVSGSHLLAPDATVEIQTTLPLILHEPD